MATIWEFEDSTGQTHRGQVVKVSDFGGSDITYRMLADCGRTLMLSGARLKAARTLHLCDWADCDRARAPQFLFCDDHLASEQARWLANEGVL